MIKYFCDICGNEITEANQPIGGATICDRLGVVIKAASGTFGFEVIVSTAGTANRGEFCKYCILDAFYKMDTRLQARQSSLKYEVPR